MMQNKITKNQLSAAQIKYIYIWLGPCANIRFTTDPITWQKARWSNISNLY